MNVVHVHCRRQQFPTADKQDYVTPVNDRLYLTHTGRKDDRRIAKEAHDHLPPAIFLFPFFPLNSFH